MAISETGYSLKRNFTEYTEPLELDASQNSSRAEQCLNRAVKMCPTLGVYGFGNPNGGLIIERVNFVSEVEYCIQWINCQKITVNINYYRGSYSYKHIVERWCGQYIPNGAFIAAAIGLGLKWKEEAGVNGVFNISKRLVEPLS